MNINGAFLLALSPIATGFQSSSLPCRYERVFWVHAKPGPDSVEGVSGMQASSEFGSTSGKARVARGIVEEMDPNDSRGELPNLAKDDAPKKDYTSDIFSLAFLLDETKEKMSQIKAMATKVKGLAVSDPHLSDLGTGPVSDAMRTALAEAKAARDAYGPKSFQAEVAWEEVEAAFEHHPKAKSHTSYRYNAAALKAHHYYDAVVDTQLLSDAIEALETVETLSRFVDMEKKRLGEQGYGDAP